MIDKTNIRMWERWSPPRALRNRGRDGHSYLHVFIGMLLALQLAACGSRPVRQPAVVMDVRSAMQLGMQAYRDNRYAEARNFFGRALARYRSVDDRAGELDALIDLADSALGQGDYAAARACLGDADNILANGNFPDRKPQVTLLEAYADMQAGDQAAAAKTIDGLLDAAGVQADIRQAALFARTQVAFDLKSADAAAWLAKLSASLGENPDALNKARYQRLEALAARAHGNMQRAAALYAQALSAYRAAYFRPGIAATHEEWADMLMTQQDWTGARDRLQRALNVRLSMYDRSHSVRDLEKLAEADKALGDGAAAFQATQLADYLKNGGDPKRWRS